MELTKRCELASNANAEPRLAVATLPLTMVRETRAGAAEALIRPWMVFVGTDFRVFHCWPLEDTALRATTPLFTGKIPCVRFCGTLLRASSGCVGTMPIGPPLPLPRSHVPVTGE